MIFFVIGAVSNRYFLTLDNLTGILQSITFLGFLSVGVGLALIAGEIDISVGSIYALAAVVTALLLKNGYGVPLAIAGGLGVGIACGLVNGIVAQVINVSAVVVTLATLGVYRALTLVVAGGSPVTGMPPHPEFFDVFGQGGIGGVSFITLLFILVAIVAEVVLRKTAFGFRLIAVGSNPVAARLVGFHVERMRIFLLGALRHARGPLRRLLGRLSAHRRTDRRRGIRADRARRRDHRRRPAHRRTRLDHRRDARPLRHRHHPESDRPLGDLAQLDARGLRHRPDRCRDGDLADQARSNQEQPDYQSVTGGNPRDFQREEEDG